MLGDLSGHLHDVRLELGSAAAHGSRGRCASASSASTVRAVKISSFAIARADEARQAARADDQAVDCADEAELRVVRADAHVALQREDGAATVGVAVDRRRSAACRTRASRTAACAAQSFAKSCGPSSSAACAMSAPAQNAFSPAPVSTITRTVVVGFERVEAVDQLGGHLAADRVVLLRPVQPRRRRRGPARSRMIGFVVSACADVIAGAETRQRTGGRSPLAEMLPLPRPSGCGRPAPPGRP